MDWKQMPELPGWIQAILAWLSLFIGVAVGAVAKIADDVKNGNRRKFWSKQLWLDFPAILMIWLLSIALVRYFGILPEIALGVAAVMGWLGPRAIDVFLAHKLREGVKND